MAMQIRIEFLNLIASQFLSSGITTVILCVAILYSDILSLVLYSLLVVVVVCRKVHVATSHKIFRVITMS